MEAVKVKTKNKKKSKTHVKSEEVAPLCEAEESSEGKSDVYDDRTATCEEEESLLKSQDESVNVATLLDEPFKSEEPTGTELEEIVAVIEPTAPQLTSTRFQNLITNPLDEIDALQETVEIFEAPIEDEDEVAELSKFVAETQELPSFTESQLLSLYVNEEYDKSWRFVERFIESEASGGIALKHPLYHLLTTYYKSREKQHLNSLEIDALVQESKEIQQRLWILKFVKITESGECQDGNPVEASHEYQVGTFNLDVLAKLVSNLATLREKVHEDHALFSYTAQISKLQIDTYIQRIVEKYPNVQTEKSVVLSEETNKNDELCEAISVLFYFQRQNYKDQGFINETRQWLNCLIAVLLRVASWRDHVFVLNHVLRCPGGIGKWAVPFIQAPQAPFNCLNPLAYLNHLIVIISIIVSPIKNREEFLSHLEKPTSDDVWVIVDSDGEEDESEGKQPQTFLKENDIISIFNQIPLESLFRLTFLIIRRDNNDLFAQISSSQLLKVFAISRYLIKILEHGILTYNSLKYQQFSKRLASIILHVAQYATDAWEIHKFESEFRDDNFIDRLQAEYDNIIVSACTAFQVTTQKSVLQFLISLPFNYVSIHTIWKLFHIIMQADKEGQLSKNSSEWYSNIEEKVPKFADAELYYILTSISNMALSRTFADWSFIKMVAVSLLWIGFVNKSTKDNCYKTCRSLLSNMSTKYPTLITVILKKLKFWISKTSTLTIYIFKDLPLSSWRLTKEDISLLTHWLLSFPVDSTESSVSRFVLYYLNWGLDPNNPNQLFLPRDIHSEVAVIVVRLAIASCPESPTSLHSTVIADTIKQLSFSSDRTINEQSLSIWVWSMLFKLRLHLVDQPFSESPLEPLPTVESLPTELVPLSRAIKDKEVTALFVSLLMTPIGHSLPLIEQSGLKIISVLIHCHRYLAALVALENIVPLFISSQESLVSSEIFYEIVVKLLSADRTYIKFALRLVSSDFPGIILKQFGDMIQSQIENYRKKYRLDTPSPFIELWLKILSKTWIENPLSTSYLIDIILKNAFFHTETRAIASEILVELLEADLHASKQKFSLLNWVSGNNNVTSLVKSSAAETSWFSLFAIEVEQSVLFTKTGLWRELLIDLSCSAKKPSIDNSLKRCCSSLNLSYVPSSTLPIYRWCQLALETPVDHPLMPVLWQKFFLLFLARMPTTSRKDLGSVGLKFFEGTTNQILFKKLQKKLSDCKSFYETKLNNNEIMTEEKRSWFTSISKIFATYLLWLTSPELHEPGVYLPELRPSLNPKKLSLIFKNDQSIWYEFVDYECVRSFQRQSVLSWEQCTCRRIDLSYKPLLSPVEPDAVTRAAKRLQKYESPLPPPVVVNLQTSSIDITVDSLYNKSLLLETLKDSFDSLLNYSQVHKVRSGEHSSLDYCLIELVPLIYDTVENNVTLHAACDTHNPGNHVPNVNSLNCAGPAIIRIKVPEVRVNQPVDLAIHKNRLEVQNLIKRSLQQSQSLVTLSSLQIQKTVESLESKYCELKKIGDVVLLDRICEAGVALFYHMTYMYTDESSSYPPMKQLITTCIEILGRTFISTDESQGPLLLTRVLETPSLTTLLSTHFSPTTSSPQTYIQLYRTLMNAVSASNYDLIFVFLTKFDIGLWIEINKPRASERSILIELVGQALSSAGQNPPQDFIMIHEVLRRQLCVLMMVEAPVHFTQTLSVALKHTESHSLATEVWYDVVNALVWKTGVQFKPHSTLAQVVANMGKFAVDQTVMTIHEAVEISQLLSDHFQNERLQYGLYGLYPKYRAYISALTTLLGTISHAVIVLTVQKYGIGNNSNACNEIWQHLSNMYSPWICPYYTQNMAQPTAAWIQQLTDDRSILLPWIATDSGHSHKVTAIFTESIRFFLTSLKGPNDILSRLWQYYVYFFANTPVPEHILSVINSNLLSLPWHQFLPSLLDLELMLKVSDTYVPFCHTLLGAIFIEISWVTWLESMSQNSPAKILSSFLHLVIKLSNEPNVRQSGKILDLLQTSKSFHWDQVDCSNYESVVNWFVMSYDPKVILNLEDEANQIDRSVIELLRYAAGFVHGETGYHSSTPRKRQIYIRGCVKMIISCLSKYKTLVLANQGKVHGTIEDLLILINTVVPQSGGNYAEAGLHVSELLTLVNLRSSPLSRITSDTIISWVSKRGDCIVSAALLRTLPTALEPAAPLGEILESILESAFNDRSGGHWENMLAHFQEPVHQKNLEESFTNSGHLLSLYLLLNKKLATQFDLEEESIIFTRLVHGLSTLKENPDLEMKIVPLFHLCLIMASRLADEKPQLVDKNLKSLVSTNENWADYKPSWGFLGAIGLKKQQSLSNRCKMLSNVFSSLVLSQMPDRKGELMTDQVPFIRTTPHSPGGLTSNNMELGPSSDAIKAIASLGNLQKDKVYIESKHIVEISLSFIRKTENSLHNAHQLYLQIAKLLYTDVRFIQCISLGS